LEDSANNYNAVYHVLKTSTSLQGKFNLHLNHKTWLTTAIYPFYKPLHQKFKIGYGINHPVASQYKTNYEENDLVSHSSSVYHEYGMGSANRKKGPSTPTSGSAG
jgi:hypothetical protein